MSCLSFSELSESQIDAMANDLRKRIALYRITSLLNSLPATTPSQPSACVIPGAVVAAISHAEQLV